MARGRGFGGSRSHGFHSHRRYGGGRSSPSLATYAASELASVPASSPQAYTIPRRGGVFDISDCKPEYSDNRIGQHMLEQFVNDLNADKRIGQSLCTCWFLFGLLGVFMPTIGMLTIFNIIRTNPIGTDINSILLGASIIALGIVLIIVGFTLNATIPQDRLNVSRKAMQEVIDKHKATTFSGADVTITPSSFCTYVKIDFNWKRPLIPPGMQANFALAQQYNMMMANMQAANMGGFNAYNMNGGFLMAQPVGAMDTAGTNVRGANNYAPNFPPPMTTIS